MQDLPKCYNCKNYIGSKICEKYEDIPQKIYIKNADCKFYNPIEKKNES
jgi:hypothetical protein